MNHRYIGSEDENCWLRIEFNVAPCADDHIFSSKFLRWKDKEDEPGEIMWENNEKYNRQLATI
jgi:hypothetical protein